MNSSCRILSFGVVGELYLVALFGVLLDGSLLNLVFKEVYPPFTTVRVCLLYQY